MSTYSSDKKMSADFSYQEIFPSMEGCGDMVQKLVCMASSSSGTSDSPEPWDGEATWYQVLGEPVSLSNSDDEVAAEVTARRMSRNVS